MPEVRRRGLSDQLGVGADRTQRGAGQGGGINPTIARLQQAYRSRQGASVSAAAATLDGTTYEADGESSAQITDMPAGIYAVTARCLLTWSSGLTDAFNLKVVAEEGSTIVGAGSGSLATGSTLDLDVTAPGFAVLAEGASLTATPSLQGTDPTATQTTTITAVRLGDTN